MQFNKLLILFPLSISFLYTGLVKGLPAVQNSNKSTTLYIKENDFGPPNIPGTYIALMQDADQKNNAIVLVSGRHDGGQTYICPWDSTNHTFNSSTFPCRPIGPSNAPADMAVVGNFGSGNKPKADIVIENGSCKSTSCTNYSAAVLYLQSENYKMGHPLTSLMDARAIASGNLSQNSYDDIVVGFAGGQDNLLLLNNGQTPLGFTPILFANPGKAMLGLAIQSFNNLPYIFGTSRGEWTKAATFSNASPNGVILKLDTSVQPPVVQTVNTFGDSSLQSVGLAIGSLDHTATRYLLVANGGEANEPAQPAELFTVSDQGVISPVSNTILTQTPSQSRPVLFYDITQQGLNDVVIGNLNDGSNPPESSVIYMNNDNLNFTPINIPNSELYEPRGMAIGQFDNQTLLIAANYCANNAPTAPPCYSKFYQLSSTPINSNATMTKVNFNFQASMLTGAISSLVPQFIQVTISDLSNKEYAVRVINQQDLLAASQISINNPFPLSNVLNVTIESRAANGVRIVTNCQLPTATKNFSYSVRTVNQKIVCSLIAK